MANILRIDQDPLVQLTTLEVREDEVQQEPTIRRATPDFAYENGGPVLRRFLYAAYAAGHIHPTTLVMSQPSDFVAGAMSTPQYWHADFTPGRAPTTDEEFAAEMFGNTGLICCAFDTSEHPDDIGTIFLEGGAVELDLAQRDRSREYVPRQNLNAHINEGGVYWWDPIVRAQLPGLIQAPIAPNGIFAYGSHHIHRVPVLVSNHGQRVLMRVNTPTDPDMKPVAENTLIHQGDPDYPRYIFWEVTPDTWRRERY